MTAVIERRASVEDYLAFEADAETKHEFANGEIISMAGAEPEHNLVVSSLARTLDRAFEAKGRSCFIFNSDTRVRIDETGLYAYPDLSVVCRRPTFDRDHKPASLLNPCLIVEVLSPTTAAYDRGPKAAHYRRRASLREYMIVSPEERRVEVLRRDTDGWWKSALFEGDVSIPLASLDVEVSLHAVFVPLDRLVEAEDDYS